MHKIDDKCLTVESEDFTAIQGSTTSRGQY